VPASSSPSPACNQLRSQRGSPRTGTEAPWLTSACPASPPTPPVQVWTAASRARPRKAPEAETGGDRDQGGGGRDQGAGDRDRGAGGQEQGAGDQDQGAEDQDQGAEDQAHGAGGSCKARGRAGEWLRLRARPQARRRHNDPARERSRRHAAAETMRRSWCCRSWSYVDARLSGSLARRPASCSPRRPAN
jgi:hypothetical protein